MKIAADIHDHPSANTATCGHNATLHNPVSADGTPEPGRLYDVPARQGRAVRVAKGQTIEVINTHGTQVCDFWAFSAANPSEFMSWEHGRAFINRVIPRVGDGLATNRRRPILTLVEDTSPGIHDTLIAACDLFRYINLGVKEYHDSCADNLRMAMMAIGVPVPEVPQPFNLWMNIPVGKDWGVSVAAAGVEGRRQGAHAGRDGLHLRDVCVPAGHDPDQQHEAGRGTFQGGGVKLSGWWGEFRTRPTTCIPGRRRDSAQTRGRVGSGRASNSPHPLDVIPDQPASAGRPGRQLRSGVRSFASVEGH